MRAGSREKLRGTSTLISKRYRQWSEGPSGGGISQRVLRGINMNMSTFRGCSSHRSSQKCSRLSRDLSQKSTNISRGAQACRSSPLTMRCSRGSPHRENILITSAGGSLDLSTRYSPFKNTSRRRKRFILLRSSLWLARIKSYSKRTVRFRNKFNTLN